MVTRSAAPPKMVWEATVPCSCGVVSSGGVVGGNSPPSFSVVWGLVGSTPCWESVVLQEWGLLVVVKLLYCAKQYSVAEDFVLRPWDVQLSVSADVGDSC